MGPKFDKLLVLDLDETLLHTSFQRIDGRPADFWMPGAPGTSSDFHVYFRPGVEHFMETCFEQFRGVGVWTAGSRGYAEETLPNFCDRDSLTFVWGRDRCVFQRDLETLDEVWIKDIKKLKGFGYRPSQILAVDDTAAKFQRSYGNHIDIPAFEGDLGDDYLPRLSEYLKELGDIPNVRTVEKRRWWTRNRP